MNPENADRYVFRGYTVVLDVLACYGILLIMMVVGEPILYAIGPEFVRSGSIAQAMNYSGMFGCLLSGCVVGARNRTPWRSKHVFYVALGLCALLQVLSLPLAHGGRQALTEWLVSSVSIVMWMLLGGQISKLFVKDTPPGRNG